jgi:hypothetical protein
MNIGFLIITYGNNYLDNCIASIRNFYEYPIYIVDNNISNKNYISEYNNVNYVNNSENSYELGAIWYACKVFKNVDKFIILHNSMMLIERFPVDFEKYNFQSFWKTFAADYSPVIYWVELKLKEFNINMEYDKLWYSVTGCCCIINTDYLKKLIELGYNKLYALNKIDAVGTEILFGYLITNVLGIKNDSLLKCTLDDNVRGIVDFKYIKKIASGQGETKSMKYINLSMYKIFDNIFNINLKNINDLNLCYIILLNEIDKCENNHIQNFLLQTHIDNIQLIFDDNKYSVILSIRHRLFTKKYFPSYYQIEKQEILSGIKKLF